MNQKRPSLIRRLISRLASHIECPSVIDASSTANHAPKSNISPALRGTLIATNSDTHTPSDSIQTRRATNATLAFNVARVCVFSSIACVLVGSTAGAYVALALCAVGFVAIVAARCLAVAEGV